MTQGGLPKKMRQTASDIKTILESIRIDPVRLESAVCEAVHQALDENGVRYRSEVKIAKRCRVDVLTDDGVAVEIKKGKPNSRAVKEQVKRYAASDLVTGVVLVSERGLVSHVQESHGKPIEYVALSANWGLAI